MSSSNISISKRKWAPKSKGGCGTCKTRHVRCDEKQPRCSPCEKSSRHCEYVGASGTSNPDPLKVVLWQPNNLTLQISQHQSHSQYEIRAFDFFRTKVATSLSSCFSSSFWTCDILQVAQKEDPVRHAIVALASLSEANLHSGTADGSARGSSKVLAIQQHAKAISDLRQKMQESTESASAVEVVLMTCVLLICFEMFQNNHESALSQMSSGVYLFCNWHSKQPSFGVTGNSNELTNQLERIFGRLMLQTILFVDTKPREWKFITPAFTPALPLMASFFRDIDEARNCLNSCMCYVYHKMLVARFQGLEYAAVPDVCDGISSQLNVDPLEPWLRCFKSFVIERKHTFTAVEEKAAVLLEIQHTTASILALAAPFSGELIFDSFEEAFTHIIALASRVSLADPDLPLFPAFDMGILPHLYFVASRCRDHLIRRQALQLLRQGPEQEGIWNRQMLGNIAERLMSMEEATIKAIKTSADIPGGSRLSVINATIDSSQRTVTLHCCRQQIGAGVVTDVLHELVNY